jgi:hypothetical protein
MNASSSRAAVVKDGALQRHRRLVLDDREHGGTLISAGVTVLIRGRPLDGG